MSINYTGSMPLYELGMYDFSRLCDVAGKYMIDADALSRLPGLCSRVTGRHRKALNRLTLLVNGHGNAPAHAYQKTTALPLPARLIKRGLSLADIGTHLRPIQRKIDSFRCSTHTNPRAEPARVHRADQAGARPCRPRSQTMGNIAGPAQVAQAQNISLTAHGLGAQGHPIRGKLRRQAHLYLKLQLNGCCQSQGRVCADGERNKCCTLCYPGNAKM